MRRALTIATAVLVLLPASALAQSMSQGSDLNLPADGGWGCETHFLPGFGFGAPDQALPTGMSSCTAYQVGTTTDNTHLVPGSGTVTKVRVKSGPNPAPLRITIIKRLFQTNPNNPAEITDAVCCTGTGRESATFQPTPNTITEVTVNLPVTTSPSVNGASGHHDIVSVSAVGPGELPVASVGPQTAGMQVFYPKVETGLQGQAEHNYFNYSLLMAYDWCAASTAAATASQACPATGGGGGGGGGGVPGGGGGDTGTGEVVAPASVRGKSLRLRRGRVTFKVRCAAGAGQRCKGRVRMLTRGKKPRLLASRRVNVAHGKTAKVTVKLSRKALRRVRKTRNKVSVEIDLGPAGKRVRPMMLRR